MHLKTHKPREKEFQCDICEKSFYTNATLATHKERHTVERPFRCSQCNFKSFKTQSDLKTHMRVHNDENRWSFSCDLCHKKFTAKGSLTKHSLLHTGEKPYKCDVCEKAFTQQGHMRNHLNSVHNKSIKSD